MAGKCGIEGQAWRLEQEMEEALILNLRQEAEKSKLKWRKALSSQNPPPVTYCLQQGHTLSLPNSHQLGTKCSNTRDYGRHLLVRPPYPLTSRLPCLSLLDYWSTYVFVGGVLHHPCLSLLLTLPHYTLLTNNSEEDNGDIYNCIRTNDLGSL